MKDRTYWILGTGAIAAFLVWRHGKKHAEEKGEEFKEGFAAGFFAPGPFTILALTGIIAWRA